jgi:uncharacterized protein HemX
MLKKILVVVLIVVAAGAGTGWYLWNKPRRSAENSRGIAIAANDLEKAYAANEKLADSLYMNKVLEVSGKVTEVSTDLDTNVVVTLQTEDGAGILCTLKDKKSSATKGQSISIKGFCSGKNLFGVALDECVFVTKEK